MTKNYLKLTLNTKSQIWEAQKHHLTKNHTEAYHIKLQKIKRNSVQIREKSLKGSQRGKQKHLTQRKVKIRIIFSPQKSSKQEENGVKIFKVLRKKSINLEFYNL